MKKPALLHSLELAYQSLDDQIETIFKRMSVLEARGFMKNPVPSMVKVQEKREAKIEELEAARIVLDQHINEVRKGNV